MSRSSWLYKGSCDVNCNNPQVAVEPPRIGVQKLISDYLISPPSKTAPTKKSPRQGVILEKPRTQRQQVLMDFFRITQRHIPGGHEDVPGTSGLEQRIGQLTNNSQTVNPTSHGILEGRNLTGGD